MHPLGYEATFAFAHWQKRLKKRVYKLILNGLNRASPDAQQYNGTSADSEKQIKQLGLLFVQSVYVHGK